MTHEGRLIAAGQHDTHARLRADATSLRKAASFFVLGDAAAQRLHEIDHPARRGNRRLALLYDAGLFGLQMRKQRLLVTVPKAHGIEISDFCYRQCARRA